MSQLSIVVPTFNERGNVGELVRRVGAALPGVDWELIFVDDDSPDDTAERLRDIGQWHPQVRCLLRVGRRGLSSACIEGMLASSAPLIAVMDADLQHDERCLAAMLQVLKDPAVDIAVASRHIGDGSTGDWAASRVAMSRFATKLSRMVLKADLSDPMSGFFMLRRTALMKCVRAGLSGVGFKILLDLFATAPMPLRFREVPYVFRDRHSGHSKLDLNVAWEFFVMLLDRALGGLVPARFIAFSLVGGLGLGVHLLALSLLFRAAGVAFVSAQAAATLVAMSCNFALNNLLTYRDMRLRGWLWWRGLVSFVLACSIGALANVGMAAYLFDRNAGWVGSAIVGVLVGAVWNYAVTAMYTWKRPARPRAAAHRRPSSSGIDAPQALSER